MSINSRPIQNISPSAKGVFLLSLELEELKYIAAMLALTALGTGTNTSDAAFELINKIEIVSNNQDFIVDALTDVDPRFVISTTAGVLAFSGAAVTIDV